MLNNEVPQKLEFISETVLAASLIIYSQEIEPVLDSKRLIVIVSIFFHKFNSFRLATSFYYDEEKSGVTIIGVA